MEHSETPVSPLGDEFSDSIMRERQSEARETPGATGII